MSATISWQPLVALSSNDQVADETRPDKEWEGGACALMSVFHKINGTSQPIRNSFLLMCGGFRDGDYDSSVHAFRMRDDCGAQLCNSLKYRGSDQSYDQIGDTWFSLGANTTFTCREAFTFLPIPETDESLQSTQKQSLPSGHVSFCGSTAAILVGGMDGAQMEPTNDQFLISLESTPTEDPSWRQLSVVFIPIPQKGDFPPPHYRAMATFLDASSMRDSYHRLLLLGGEDSDDFLPLDCAYMLSFNIQSYGKVSDFQSAMCPSASYENFLWHRISLNAGIERPVSTNPFPCPRSLAVLVSLGRALPGKEQANATYHTILLYGGITSHLHCQQKEQNDNNTPITLGDLHALVLFSSYSDHDSLSSPVYKAFWKNIATDFSGLPILFPRSNGGCGVSCSTQNKNKPIVGVLFGGKDRSEGSDDIIMCLYDTKEPKIEQKMPMHSADCHQTQEHTDFRVELSLRFDACSRDVPVCLRFTRIVAPKRIDSTDDRILIHQFSPGAVDGIPHWRYLAGGCSLPPPSNDNEKVTNMSFAIVGGDSRHPDVCNHHSYIGTIHLLLE